MLPSPGHLIQNKPNVNKVKRKNGPVHPVNLPNYRQDFLKNFAKIHFCGQLFSYFHGFGVGPFNLEESVCEKIPLATMHLQE